MFAGPQSRKGSTSTQQPYTPPPLQRHALLLEELTYTKTWSAELTTYFADTCVSCAQLDHAKFLCAYHDIAFPLSFQDEVAVKERGEVLMQEAAKQAAAQMDGASAFIERLVDGNKVQTRAESHFEGLEDTMGTDERRYIKSVWELEGTGCYKFCTLASAAPLVAPFLTQMRAHGACGEQEKVTDTFAQGVVYLSRMAGAKSRGCSIFAELELKRQYCAHVLGFFTASQALEAVNSIHLDESLKCAGKYVDDLTAVMEDAVKFQQSTMELTMLKVACIAIIKQYAVFFHSVLSFLEGANGDYSAFAASLAPGNGAMLGVDRYPFLKPLFFFSKQGHYSTRICHSPVTGVSASFLQPQKMLMASTSRHAILPSGNNDFLIYFSDMVCCVLARGSSYATLFVLSAVASQPIATALDTIVQCAELQALLEPLSEVKLLVQSLWGGSLGAAWTHAQAAANKYLSPCKWITALQMSKLKAGVLRAICYQYLRARTVTALPHAAQQLKLKGGLEELLAIAEELILSGRLNARISRVTGKLRMVVPSTTTDERAVLADTLQTSDVMLAKTQELLLLQSIQRTYLTPTLAALDLAVTRPAVLEERRGRGRNRAL